MVNSCKLDKIIEGLNHKMILQNIGLNGFEDADLTEVETAFMTQYSPEKVFIIYGTLAPNCPNHSVIEHIQGTWRKGIVRGKLENKGWGAESGYYGFKHVPFKEQSEIKAFALSSDELVRHWQFLDEFEGSGYKRILTAFESENGEIAVGSIYAINDDYQ